MNSPLCDDAYSELFLRMEEYWRRVKKEKELSGISIEKSKTIGNTDLTSHGRPLKWVKEDKPMSVLDCRGLACPQPVVTTKKALDQMNEGELIVIVDNATSSNNVERFAQSQGCTAEVEERGQDFSVRIRKGKKVTETAASQGKEKAKKVVVYINSHLMGNGDEALGSFLMKAFLKTLLDLETQPNRLILLNSGVQLAAQGSKVLDSLKALSGKGVEIVACGSCLEFYGLKEKLEVGTVSNMFDILQSMMEADRVIRP
jgi:selenium metabolism protein YedF